MRKSTLFIALALFSVLVAGCNTVKGAGQDVQDAGSAIERAADK